MKIISILIVSLLLGGCVESSGKDKGSRELLPDHEKYAHDGYNQLPDSLKPEFEPDVQIGPIELLDSNLVLSFLGSDVMNRLSDKRLPATTVYSADENQTLTVYFHPGGIRNEFSEFEIKYASSVTRDKYTTTEEEFETESGIKLGMSVGTLRAIKGEPLRIVKGSLNEYYYELRGKENSAILEKHNMPMYYSSYKFENGYLKEFKFGFEYP